MAEDQQGSLSGQDPEINPLELFQKVAEAIDAHDYEEALELAMQALDDELTGEELANQLKAWIAFCHFQADRFEEALNWYREAGDEVEMTDDESYAYAWTLYHEGEYYEASLALDMISEEFQDDPAVLTLRGIVGYNFDEPDWQEILDNLLLAAEKNPEKSEDFIIGECLRMLERYEESYPYYRKAIEAQPDNAKNYYFYGVAKLLGDEPEQAIIAMQESLARDDENANVHLDLARLLIAVDRKEEALEHIERAIALGEPEAKEVLTMLMSSEYATDAEDGDHDGEDHDDEEEYEDEDYEWEEEDYGDYLKRLHPLAQETMYSIRHRFPFKMSGMLIGVALAAAAAIGVMITQYERVPGPPPVVEDRLYADEATGFITMSQFAEGDRLIETPIAEGTPLLPVARYRRQMLVELPDGQRGLVPQTALDRYHQVTIPPGTRLYREPHGGASIGEVGEAGARATSLSVVSEYRIERQHVQLHDDGTIAYIPNRIMRRDLDQMQLPRLNSRNQRLYERDRLEQALKGADIGQVTRRLGVPAAHLTDPSAGQTIYLFPHVMLIEEGQRWPRAAVITEDGRVTRIVAQGEAGTLPIDQMNAISYIQASGLPNLYLQSSPWFTPAGSDWISLRIDDLKEWSRTVGWIVQILVILFFIILVILIIYSLFGIPVLLTWPVIYLMGKTTRLPNGLLHLVMWLLLMAGYTGLFFLSIGLLDLKMNNFFITLYGIFVFFFFLSMGLQGSEYLTSSRCADCRIWKSADLLASIYLGYEKSVSYERVYTGKSTSSDGQTEYHYYEERPRYSFKYFYQDFFNCQLCGKRWDTKETEYRKRDDMDHSRVPA